MSLATSVEWRSAGHSHSPLDRVYRTRTLSQMTPQLSRAVESEPVYEQSQDCEMLCSGTYVRLTVVLSRVFFCLSPIRKLWL